ncbi:MAG: metal ABC transporter substrate-binding protein [Cellulosilyticaceae bacterium]
MKYKKTIILSVCLIAYIGFIISRYNTTTELDVDTALQEEQMTVITSFYPMYMHVKELTKDVPINVRNMTSSQVGCLHDYQLRVEDMKTLQEGQILVINGLGAESFITKAYEQNKELQVINASETLEEILGYHEEEHNQEDAHNAKEEHADEAGDTHIEGNFEDEHSGHNHANEHIWLSIEGSIEQVKNISQGLQELDPKHKEQYKINEKNYVEELVGVKTEMQQELSGLKGRKIVLVHNSFEYLAEEIGLEIVAMISGEEEAPTAREVEEIIKLIEENQIQRIFTELQYKNLGIVKTIGRESKSRIYELDSLVTTGSQVNQGEVEYVQRMRKNIEVLKEAYGL